MINDNIIQSKRPKDVTKKCFLNWILAAEPTMLYEKVERQS